MEVDSNSMDILFEEKKQHNRKISPCREKKCHQIKLNFFSLQCTTKCFMQLQWANFCQKAPKRLIMVFLVLQTRGYLPLQCTTYCAMHTSAVQCTQFLCNVCCIALLIFCTLQIVQKFAVQFYRKCN